MVTPYARTRSGGGSPAVVASPFSYNRRLGVASPSVAKTREVNHLRSEAASLSRRHSLSMLTRSKSAHTGANGVTGGSALSGMKKKERSWMSPSNAKRLLDTLESLNTPIMESRKTVSLAQPESQPWSKSPRSTPSSERAAIPASKLIVGGNINRDVRVAHPISSSPAKRTRPTYRPGTPSLAKTIQLQQARRLMPQHPPQNDHLQQQQQQQLGQEEQQSTKDIRTYTTGQRRSHEATSPDMPKNKRQKASDGTALELDPLDKENASASQARKGRIDRMKRARDRRRGVYKPRKVQSNVNWRFNARFDASSDSEEVSDSEGSESSDDDANYELKAPPPKSVAPSAKPFESSFEARSAETGATPKPGSETASAPGGTAVTASMGLFGVAKPPTQYKSAVDDIDKPAKEQTTSVPRFGGFGGSSSAATGIPTTRTPAFAPSSTTSATFGSGAKAVPKGDVEAKEEESTKPSAGSSFTPFGASTTSAGPTSEADKGGALSQFGTVRASAKIDGSADAMSLFGGLTNKPQGSIATTTAPTSVMAAETSAVDIKPQLFGGNAPEVSAQDSTVAGTPKGFTIGSKAASSTVTSTVESPKQQDKGDEMASKPAFSGFSFNIAPASKGEGTATKSIELTNRVPQSSFSSFATAKPSASFMDGAAANKPASEGLFGTVATTTTTTTTATFNVTSAEGKPASNLIVGSFGGPKDTATTATVTAAPVFGGGTSKISGTESGIGNAAGSGFATPTQEQDKPSTPVFGTTKPSAVGTSGGDAGLFGGPALSSTFNFGSTTTSTASKSPVPLHAVACVSNSVNEKPSKPPTAIFPVFGSSSSASTVATLKAEDTSTSSKPPGMFNFGAPTSQTQPSVAFNFSGSGSGGSQTKAEESKPFSGFGGFTSSIVPSSQGSTATVSVPAATSTDTAAAAAVKSGGQFMSGAPTSFMFAAQTNGPNNGGSGLFGSSQQQSSDSKTPQTVPSFGVFGSQAAAGQPPQSTSLALGSAANIARDDDMSMMADVPTTSGAAPQQPNAFGTPTQSFGSPSQTSFKFAVQTAPQPSSSSAFGSRDASPFATSSSQQQQQQQKQPADMFGAPSSGGVGTFSFNGATSMSSGTAGSGSGSGSGMFNLGAAPSNEAR
ncbi:hypothetical protein EV182_002401, partial [Spiromyces aspiralis]